MLKRLSSVLLAVMLALAGAAYGQCPGDCRGDGEVTVDELITGVNIALGVNPIDLCRAVDTDGDGQVAVNELIAAVNSALNGCVGTRPTATHTPPAATPTPTVGIVSPQILGTWSGTGIDTTTGATRSVRIRIEEVGSAALVTDLGGNLITSGSSLTLTALTPTTLSFAETSGTRVESMQISPNQDGLIGTYSNLTLGVPPVGTSITFVLSRES